MKSTEQLKEEHDVIRTALDVLDVLATRLERGQEAPANAFADLVEFFRFYADKSHHAKEERCLFPFLVEAGLPDRGGPIGVMLHEHDIGRGHLAQIRELYPGLPESSPELARACRSYVKVLGDHIVKEDELLFMMADRLLAGPADRRMIEAFAYHERNELGEGGREKHERTIAQLAKTYLSRS